MTVTSCLHPRWIPAETLIWPGKQGVVRPRARRRKEKREIPWPPLLTLISRYILIAF